jgi:hypothetical protein
MQHAVVASCQELMVDQLEDSVTFLGVLVQTTADEILNLGRGRFTAREVDLILHHLRQVPLVTDLERSFTEQQLIGHHSDIPHVNLVIILLLLRDFR